MAEQADHGWQKTLRRRIMVAAAAFVLWTIAIEARLVYLQVFEYDDLLAWADDQQSQIVPVSAKRGDIVDRAGGILAFSAPAESIYATPVKVASEVTTPAETIARICAALRNCTKEEQQEMLRRVTRKTKDGNLQYSAVIRRAVSPEQAKRVKALNLESLHFLTENRRFYPNAELAAHLLGYVSLEDKGLAKGLAGLEAKYDDVLGGTPGKVRLLIGANKRPFSRIEKASTPGGASLELTIDSTIQHVAERELQEGVKWSGASGGVVIVMDPYTGEILALANYPTFNPNAFNWFDDDARRNRAIQDLYDPGSTFKVVTAGAALEERLFSPTDLINTSPGVIRFGARVIDEAKGHNYGTLSFSDIFVKSSNVGAIKIGLTLGPERLHTWVGRFGFGTRLSPDLSGENAGLVTAVEELNDSAVASISMGYQIGVTPLQMAAAVSSIANGGELVQPRVVRGIIRDGVMPGFQRKVLRRTVSQDVAREMTTIMEDVVERGTGKSAQIDGYRIAGKTGTAAKIVNRDYSNTDFNVSFAGFLPSRDPVFTILVVIDTPTKVSPYGGSVAAPIFQKIASALIRHRGIPPSLNPAPPVVIARRDQVRERPVSGSAEPPQIVALAANPASAAVVPDLTGMSAREAASTLVRLGLSPRVLGDGQVVNQRPAAGTALETIHSATVWLDRRSRIMPLEGDPTTAADTLTTDRSRR